VDSSVRLTPPFDDDRSLSGFTRGQNSGLAFDPLATIREHRRLLGVAAVLGLVIALLLGFVQTPMYMSTGSFLPQARRSQTNLPAVAAQLGLSISNGEANQSPQFYVDLLKSREILKPVVRASYAFASRGKRLVGTLPEIYGVDAPRSEGGVEEAMKRLDRNMSAAASAKTGVVSVSVKTPWPVLSGQLLQRILEEVNTFNLESRQNQATAERRFSEERLVASQSELRAAEERLQNFLEDNREWRSSPKLTFEQDRLAREIGTRQQVYTTIAQMYEQARMDEVRNTPLITIVEKPNVPLKPESRHLLRNAAFAVFIALLIALLAAFASERFDPVARRRPSRN